MRSTADSSDSSQLQEVEGTTGGKQLAPDDLLALRTFFLLLDAWDRNDNPASSVSAWNSISITDIVDVCKYCDEKLACLFLCRSVFNICWSSTNPKRPPRIKDWSNCTRGQRYIAHAGNRSQQEPLLISSQLLALLICRRSSTYLRTWHHWLRAILAGQSIICLVSC